MLAPVILIRPPQSVALRDHLGIVEDLATAQLALWGDWQRMVWRAMWGV